MMDDATVNIIIETIRRDERERCAMIAEARAILWERDEDRSLWTKANEARAIAHEIRSTK